MSVEAILCVRNLFETVEVSRSEHHVLLTLATYANQDAEAWPTQSRLAKEMSYSRSAINKTLKDLEAKGLLRIKRSTKHQGLRYYLLTLPETVARVPGPGGTTRADALAEAQSSVVGETLASTKCRGGDTKCRGGDTERQKKDKVNPSLAKYSANVEEAEQEKEGLKEKDQRTTPQPNLQTIDEVSPTVGRLFRELATREKTPPSDAQLEARAKRLIDAAEGDWATTRGLFEQALGKPELSTPFGWVMSQLPRVRRRMQQRETPQDRNLAERGSGIPSLREREEEAHNQKQKLRRQEQELLAKEKRRQWQK